MKTNNTILRFLGKKLAVILLIAGSTAGAFATLGEGSTTRKRNDPNKPLLSNKTQANSFSLRSGYNFRGTHVITNSEKYLSLNTYITYQKGNTTYILPLKKKVILENVKIDLSNRQLRRN